VVFSAQRRHFIAAHAGSMMESCIATGLRAYIHKDIVLWSTYIHTYIHIYVYIHLCTTEEETLLQRLLGRYSLYNCYSMYVYSVYSTYT